MTASTRPAERTQLMARALGPFFTIVPAVIAVRSDAMQVLLARFEADPMWAWVLGSMLLMAGCIIIALHQYWRSAAAVIISAIGWFLGFRGVLLLTAPQAYTAAADALSGPAGQLIVQGIFGVLVLAGLYLTYAGWIAPLRHVQQPAAPKQASGR